MQTEINSGKSKEELDWLDNIKKSIAEGAELHRKLRDECMAEINQRRESGESKH